MGMSSVLLIPLSLPLRTHWAIHVFGLFVFETGSYYVDHSGLKFVEICHPIFSECWDQRHVPPCPIGKFSFNLQFLIYK